MPGARSSRATRGSATWPPCWSGCNDGAVTETNHRSAMALRHELALTVTCRGLGMRLGFAMAVISVRALGADGRGRYFLLVTTAMLVAQVGTLGLHATLPYEAARAPEEETRLAEDAWWVSFGLGSALAVIVF